MTSKRAPSKTTATTAMWTESRPNSGDDTTWALGPSTFRESAPGDALYDDLEDFVLDQSEGEESSDDAGRTKKSGSGDRKQSKVSEGDSGVKEAAGSSSRNASNNTDNQTPQLQPTTKRKRRRVVYTADEELVLYLLHNHVSLEHSTRTDIFNRVFHDSGVIREKGALVMQWHRFKADYEEKFATLSTAELAEHEAWKKKIDKAMKDAGMASQIDGKQDNDSDSADDQEPRLATPKPKQPRKPRQSSQAREPRTKYTADHDIVLHILRSRKNIEAGALADVFNHIFRAEGVVRDKVALGKHWGRFKDSIQKRMDKLSPAELVEHKAWKQKVDDAIEELSQ
jgi:hypothetical protein